MVQQPASLAGALVNALNPIPFTKYVSYIGKEDGMSCREFEANLLSEYFMLDLSHGYVNYKWNNNMLYDIFGMYSNQDGDVVRALMLNELTCSEVNNNYYGRAGFICLQMKGMSLDDWCEQQARRSTRGDEFSVYVLCHLFMRHTMIHSKSRPWYTIQQMGGGFNYTSACQTYLLYMGNQRYGILIPKPPPIPPVVSSPVSVQNQAILAHAGILASPTAMTPVSNMILHILQVAVAPVVTSNAQPVPAMPVPSTSHDSIENKESATTGDNTMDTHEDREQDSDQATPDNISVTSSIKDNNIVNNVTRVLTADVLNKECTVNIARLDPDLVARYSIVNGNTKSDSDSMDDKPLLILRNELHTSSPRQIVNIPTGSESESESEDNIPLSELYNRDQGRPKHRVPRKRYTETSPEPDNSDIDNDYGTAQNKPRKPVPSHGPSAEKIGAQQLMSGRRAWKTLSVEKDAMQNSTCY